MAPHILLVDDDAMMLQGLSAMVELRLKGVAIDTYESAAAALERIGHIDYDAVVSDIKMPGMDGFQLMEQVLKIRSSTPTLLVTGHGDHDMGVKALKAGAYAFIQKPIDRDYFIAWLTRAIELRHLSRAVEQQNQMLERTVQERTAELERTNQELKMALGQQRDKEEALGASEARFRAIVETTPECVKLVAFDGTVLHMSPSGLRMVEAECVEMVVGKSVYGLIAPEYREAFRAFNERICRGEKDSLQYDIVGLKGTRRQMETNAAPLRNPDGTVAHLAVTRDITERQRAEQALRASEAQLEAELTDTKLLQNISRELTDQEQVEGLYEKIIEAAVAIMRSDCASMQMLYPERGSAGELRLLAFRGFDPQAAKFWEWVRADSGSTCGQALRTGQRAIAPDVETCECMAGTDDLVVYRQAGIQAVQSTPLLSRSGKMLGMLSTHWREPHQPSERDLRLLDILARQAADLIERRQAEKALRQRTAQFETLLNQAPLGVYLIDADFRIRQVNPIARPVFGDIPDLIGRDFDEVIHILWSKDYADEVVRLFRHTLDSGEPYVTPERIEQRLHRGVTEFYEWRIDRIESPDGRYGVVCYFRDISSQVQAREAIAESEERFRTLADHMSEFAWMADGTGWIFWYNQRWYDYTGMTREEMQGWGWQTVHHPDHLDRVVTKWRRAHETGEPWEDTFPLCGTDGDYRWFLSRAQPIRDANGQIIRWFGTNTDVTEQLAAEASVRDKQAQLIQASKLASIGELASGVAHELNNPLNNIGLLVGNVLDHVQNDPIDPLKVRKNLTATLEQVNKAAAIIGHLRAFARTASTPPEPLDLHRVIRSAISLVEAQLRHHNVKLVLDLTPNDPVVLGNAIQLEQVFINLLTNAHDAVERAVEKRIAMTSTMRMSRVEVSVQDTGVGIPPEYHARIFDPFFTTKDVGKGTGLGLSISYGIIQEHGGTITVESEPGKGATFVVMLPAHSSRG